MKYIDLVHKKLIAEFKNHALKSKTPEHTKCIEALSDFLTQLKHKIDEDVSSNEGANGHIDIVCKLPDSKSLEITALGGLYAITANFEDGKAPHLTAFSCSGKYSGGLTARQIVTLELFVNDSGHVEVKCNKTAEQLAEQIYETISTFR